MRRVRQVRREFELLGSSALGRGAAEGRIDWTLSRGSGTRRHVTTRRHVRFEECLAVAHISRGWRRGVECVGFFRREIFFTRPRCGTHKFLLKH